MSSQSLSRRDVLSGAIAIGAAAALPALSHAEPLRGREVGEAIDAAALPSRTCHSASPIQGGYALIAGGFVAGRATNSALLLHPGGALSVVSPMLSARARHASLTLPDGRVLVLGGFNGAFMAAVELYDPYRDTWVEMPRLPSPRADFAATLEGMSITLIGGTGPISAPLTAHYELNA